jgi:hypothetical protein
MYNHIVGFDIVGQLMFGNYQEIVEQELFVP